jgi:hypothetical protein
MEYEGWIIKEGGSVFSNWQKRYAVLNSTFGNLSYFAKKEDVEYGVIPKNIVEVSGAEIVEVEKKKKGKNYCFCILQPSRAFYAYCEKKEEYDIWVEKLKLVFDSF